ncbi:MAG: glycosyltransferase family 4 protein, partial [candidate division WOR-3 bacterium]
RNLHDNILFLGQRDDVAELLSNSDVYVSSSEWEGFGLSIVEAMAAGKPIIATKVGAVPELVYDKINGLLVENKDVKALTSAILQLADNPTLIKKMGKENRIRACKRFDIVNTAKKYEELYLKLHQKNLNKKDLAL